MGAVDSSGRHTKIWGEDAAEFRPERFLETNMDGELKFVKPSSFKFTAFQGGKRICMGMNMAYVLLGLMLGSSVLVVAVFGGAVSQ